MKNNFVKFQKQPLAFLKRGLQKTILGPLIYGQGDDYDASRYWHDRFSNYGVSFKAVGDEGFSEEENIKMYAEVAQVFIDACQNEQINFQNANVLEIGCGTGFYTKLLYELGVKNYLGVDITDVFFPALREKFPEFQFLKKDITKDKLELKFDLVVMIDVIEHIVKDSKLDFAMENIQNCLVEDGVFITAPIMRQSRKHLFYVRFWSLEDIKQRFPGYALSELTPFRSGHMLTLRK
jgi:SAM-dependent methyltransferase